MLRFTFRAQFCAAAILLATTGCGDDDATTRPDGGRDGGGTDSGGDTDATVDMDAGTDSGGPVDAGMDAGPPPPCEAPTIPDLGTVPVVAGMSFDNPVFLTQAPGDAETLFVVEKAGYIRAIRDGAVLPTPFLDIDAVVSSGGEMGLLGLAFHPDYETNGRFFVYYTPSGRNVVAEYRRSDGDPLVADRTEIDRLVDIPDPESNHNGGMLAFGPDGFLYVAMGDGGAGGDPHGPIGNGQNLQTLLGKILRLDVEAAASEYVAAGNPFTSPDGLPQIWAYGLRNPWRFSFDRFTGDLYIADVGQNAVEEVDFQPASSMGGENYGWRAFEGSSVFDGSLAGMVTNHTPPIFEVGHDSTTEVLRGACSITGGYVYHGTAIPALRGAYLFGDACSDDVAAFRYCEGEVMGAQRIPSLNGLGAQLSSFGEDHDGELYLIYHASGDVLKIVPM